MGGRFRLFALFPLLPFFLALAGCVERSPAPPGPSAPIGPIFGSITAAQTFLATPLPLVGLKVQLATYNRRNAGELVLRLRGGSGEELRTMRVEAASLQDNRFREFRFEAVQLASDEPLVFSIQSTARDAENAISVWATAGDVVRGRASYDGVPRDVDLVFTPIYAEPLHEAAGVQILRLVADFPAPLSAAVALLAPGFLLSSLFVRRSTHGLALQLAAAPAFGVSAAAVLTLYATVVGLPLNRGSVGVAAAAAATLIVGLEVIRRRESRVLSLESSAQAAPDPRPETAPDPRPETRDPRPVTAALLAAAAASILMRAIALEDGSAPPGADTYHHVLITQLILDRGGIPTSYEPYAPIGSFSYHFGVHSLAATTALLAGRPALEAVSALAPLLNGMLCLSVYFLARAGGLDRLAAVVAAIAVAVVDPLSMQLLDVGRYPQSAGLLVLPVALAFALGGTVGSASRWDQLRTVAGGGVLAAGLFLTHYRVAIFLVAIVALRLCWELARPFLRKALRKPEAVGHRSPHGGQGRPSPLPLAVGGVAILLVIPWLVRLWQGFTFGLGGSGGRYAPQYYELDRIADAVGHRGLVVLLVGALIGLGLAVRNRQPLLTLLGVWAFAQLALSNPYWLPLPGVGYVDTVTVVSSLFLPASLLAGYAASSLLKGSLRWGSPPLLRGRVGVGGRTAIPALFALGLIGLAVWGALQLPQLVQPAHRVLRDGDLAAAQWVKRSTPPDARFLVNAFILEWQPDFVAPTDGGYWLPLLTRRQTTLLPMVYPAERGVPAPEIESMERIARAVQRDPSAPETLALLRAAGVTHLYLGVRRGPISEPQVAASGAYRRTFHAGGVSVYEVVSR